MKVVEYWSLGKGKRKPYDVFNMPIDFSVLDFSKATLDDCFLTVPYMPVDHATIFGGLGDMAATDYNEKGELL